ncbi:nucleotide sugar dehydrogenase [Halosimplex carlsbadense 2-9-1]|uniref:UDP-N-acetyl-D-mannosamine dehydrogenase n=1 Tax=Halosimplex carlsbadense 2-9-1 TaxID=797114 RepID=M0CGB2_9EURY|nr:nucleotide sugar dehydrogenase [Halosimplex carlsbadense]ELZ22315.1 nucleotide sugar dehydrogenase [Halosimplex carlsbadense 2-9-1]
MSSQRSEPTGLYGADADEPTQRRAFTGGAVPVAVYGLGKMGLPLAAVYAEVSGAVTGVDIDPEVARAVDAGECPVEGEPGLPGAVERLTADGSLSATTDAVGAAAEASVHVLIVPTLVSDDQPDLSALEAAVRSVGEGLDPGDTVVVESTVPPRTCRDRVTPWLEAESGLELGEFGLAFCPERTMSGRALEDIRGAHPKVVGGADEESARVAELIYGQVTDAEVYTVSDCTTAECVKVFEGLYRDVNIALANELATLAGEFGVDVPEAIEVANTQPFCDIHDPGPGVGGHCIPYYPYFVISEFESATPLLQTARHVNEYMPEYTVDRAAEALADRGRDLSDATAAVFGLAYRPGVDETRASPGVDIAELLADRAETVYAVDPVTTDSPPAGVERVSLADIGARELDLAVVATAHDEFESIPWTAFDDSVVLDGRRQLDADAIGHPLVRFGDGSGEN